MFGLSVRRGENKRRRFYRDATPNRYCWLISTAAGKRSSELAASFFFVAFTGRLLQVIALAACSIFSRSWGLVSFIQSIEHSFPFLQYVPQIPYPPDRKYWYESSATSLLSPRRPPCKIFWDGWEGGQSEDQTPGKERKQESEGKRKGRVLSCGPIP